jgi:hypothetical protein
MTPMFDLDTTPLPHAARHPVVLVAAAPPESSPLVSAPRAAASPATAFAEPARLLYDVQAGDSSAYTAQGELLWQPAAGHYSARLDMSVFGIRLRSWTSTGALGPAGLQPTLFADQGRGREQTTHFHRSKGTITFSENTQEVPLQTGAQDKLSALLQLSALVAGAPDAYPAGAVIRFQAADAHHAELWNFKAGAAETLRLPGGEVRALKFSKAPTGNFNQGIEVWLAPGQQYLPVRLRITEANGAYADLMWRRTQRTE